MDIWKIMEERHSVRAYLDKPIEESTREALLEKIDGCNKESGLSIQLRENEPEVFSGMLAKYGNFIGVNSYIAIVGDKSEDLDESAGYYGQKIVLLAQELGLNTCWVAASYSKRKSR